MEDYNLRRYTVPKRIGFIDITKGVLITCLCFHHYPQALKTNGIEGLSISFVYDTFIFYACYFMQAFFFITGFCTNFNVNLNDFLKKNVKQLVIPSLAFITTRKIVLYSVFGIPSLPWYQYCYLEWFLISLFFSKIILWHFENKLNDISPWKKNVIIAIFALLLLRIGASHHICGYDFTQYFYYRNVCVMFIFLYFGKLFKENIRFFLPCMRFGGGFSVYYLSCISIWD